MKDKCFLFHLEFGLNHKLNLNSDMVSICCCSNLFPCLIWPLGVREEDYL